MTENNKKGIFHKIWRFFDRFEDHNRAFLSHYPIVYAIVGGFGIIQYWRGVWHAADEWGWNATTSVLIGLIVLLATGLMVSFFIGDNILLTGLRREKKLVEKTEEELELEEGEVQNIKTHISAIEKSLEEIKKKLNKNEDHHA